MAEKPAAEKTHLPTPRRLQKAREEGQLPQSVELMSITALFVLVATITLMGPNLMEWTTTQIKQGMSCENSVFADTETFVNFVNGKIVSLILTILPILAALVAGSILAGVCMSGFNFTPGAIKLKFNMLNPIAGFGKLVNARSMVKLLIDVLKLTFISLIVFFYLRDKLEVLAKLRWVWSAQILTAIARIILGLMIRVCIAILILAIADVIYQRWKYIEDLKMTLQEVRQDRKDTEGSPQVKSRIRRIQLQMAMKRILQEVPKASVVLVNPTHVAVALKYDAKTMDAPVMVAKGADHLAERIREIATAYGVPVIQRPELARTIYSTVKPGNPIPEHLFVAVAEVLAMLYRLRQKKK